MNKDEIIRYYDDLMRLAVSKCGSQTDAEDLVGDTMLAAFSYINKGGRIEHPKTWLANTLCHKYNDSLQKKYRAPTTVNFEDSFEIPPEEEEYFSSEDAAKIRKELNHIAYGDATNYFAMIVVRKAYENGLHMKNVDYCCPPVVLVYDEAKNKN